MQERPFGHHQRNRKPLYGIALAALVLAGCSAGNTATTTAAASGGATPPPTTPTASTIAATTTTIAPTTTPASTAPADPARVLAERHLAFANVIDECAMDPVACDPAVSFTEYVSTDSDQYRFYAEGIQGLIDAGQHIANPERIEREIVLAEVGADGTGHTVNCIANGATYVEADNSTLPDEIAYGREDYFWELNDGKWITTAGILDGIGPEGDGECEF